MTGSVRAHIFFSTGQKKAQLIMIKYEDWRGFIYDEIYKFQKDYADSRPYRFKKLDPICICKPGKSPWSNNP